MGDAPAIAHLLDLTGALGVGQLPDRTWPPHIRHVERPTRGDWDRIYADVRKTEVG